jgi:hypothetical protein
VNEKTVIEAFCYTYAGLSWVGRVEGRRLGLNCARTANRRGCCLERASLRATVTWLFSRKYIFLHFWWRIRKCKGNQKLNCSLVIVALATPAALASKRQEQENINAREKCT